MKIQYLAIVTTDITCDICGMSAVPAHFEIISSPKRPSEIVDLILWIDCHIADPENRSLRISPLKRARLTRWKTFRQRAAQIPAKISPASCDLD
jgi:hypothetical protein